MPSRYGPGVLPRYPVAERTGFERAVGAIGQAVGGYNDIMERREEKKRQEEERALEQAIMGREHGVVLNPENELNPEWQPPTFDPAVMTPAFNPDDPDPRFEGVGFGAEGPPTPGVGRGFGVRSSGFEFAAPGPQPDQFEQAFNQPQRKAFTSPEERGMRRLAQVGESSVYYDPTITKEHEERQRQESEITRFGGALAGRPGMENATPGDIDFMARYGQSQAVSRVTEAMRRGDRKGANEAARKALQSHPEFGQHYANFPTDPDFDWVAELQKVTGEAIKSQMRMGEEAHEAALKPPSASTSGRGPAGLTRDQAWENAFDLYGGSDPDRVSRGAEELYNTGQIAPPLDDRTVAMAHAELRKQPLTNPRRVLSLAGYSEEEIDYILHYKGPRPQ